MTALTLALLSVIACGDWVEVRPSSAQDGPSGAGGSGTVSSAGGSLPGLGGAPSCDCAPARKVSLAKATCVEGVAAFGIFGGGLEFRDRDFSAWVHPSEDVTLQQAFAPVLWDPEVGVYVECADGASAELWGFP